MQIEKLVFLSFVLKPKKSPIDITFSFITLITPLLLFSYISIKFKFAKMPNNSNWLSLYGVSILTGIGFTMSLFVGNLAFIENTQYIDGVKIGVLTGSLLSTVFGYIILLMSSKK